MIEKQSFTVRNVLNTRVQCVGKIHRFIMLNLVVHTVTTGFKGLSYFFFLSEWPSHNFEANAQLSGQETLFQWNSNFRHMSQMNAAHSLMSCFFKVLLNSAFLPMPKSPK